MDDAIPLAILAALRRRGLRPRFDEPRNGGELLLSCWSASERACFYRAMSRYSFRLVLRDLIRLGQGAPCPAEALTRHASARAVQEHLRTLEQLGLTRQEGGGQRLLVPAKSFGPSLEWFVGEVLAQELGFVVGRSIPLRGGSTGGDLDLVALAEGVLLLVEVKSGPPKHLAVPQVSAFLDRVAALAPHGAIFFEDTELRMTDKIVGLFEEALRLRGSARRPQRLERELYQVGTGIYIANAHPDLISNLTSCVSQLFRQPCWPLTPLG